jgi:tryptophanase
MHTIIEPFRVKMTEALPITTRGHREARLASARNNVFLLDAEDITIDLLTDSGTGAMSARQWAALMLGDESYAGSTSWHRFEKTVREITGFKHIFPVHQGRAAERILAATRLKPGAIVPNNSHFDTTRANFEYSGAQAVDLLTPEGEDIYSETRFKGNMDIDKLAHIIDTKGQGNIPFCMITVTNNAAGGQPVSMENIKSVKETLNKYHIPLVIDACRFAENSYFIKEYEPGFADREPERNRQGNVRARRRRYDERQEGRFGEYRRFFWLRTINGPRISATCSSSRKASRPMAGLRDAIWRPLRSG